MRLFALISLTLFLLMLVAWPLSHAADPTQHFLSLGGETRACLSHGRFSLYNADVPYRGSIIQVDTNPRVLTERQCDVPGIYFRYFRFAEGSLWTLSIQLWVLLVAAGALPAIALVALVRRRSAPPSGLRFSVSRLTTDSS